MDINKNIVILFVRAKPAHAWHKGMKKAFAVCKKVGLSPDWVKVAELTERSLSQNTVLVLADFQSDVIKDLPEDDCLIVGPECLAACVEGELPIPENNSPVFNLVMKNLVICTSKMIKQKKVDISRLVGYMGGCCTDRMTDSVTHIVADQTNSPKCEAAAEKKIPIMNSTWIYETWKNSLEDPDINCQDPEIMKKHKLPVFKGIEITISNLNKQSRTMYSKLIESHGGIYSPSLIQKKIHYVITDKHIGEKVKSAGSWGIPVVSPAWLEDSIKAGGPLPSTNYEVKAGVKCSTPTSDLPSFTMGSEDISAVCRASVTSQPVEETLDITSSSTASFCAGSKSFFKPLPRPPSAPDQRHKELLEELKPADISKAGCFLDGCKIYLSGWSQAEMDKLRKLLIKAGATVFGHLTEGVSHIVVGQFSPSDVQQLSSLTTNPDMVTLEWVKASIAELQPAKVTPYLCLRSNENKPPPPSPLSSKGVQLLKSKTKSDSEDEAALSRSVSRKLFVKTNNHPVERVVSKEKEKEDDGIEMLKVVAETPMELEAEPIGYQTETVALPNPPPAPMSNIAPEEASTFNNQIIFQGLVFMVLGFDSNNSAVEVIESSGGTVVPITFAGVADYAVVPLEGVPDKFSASEVVNPLWVEDCMEQGKVLAVEYYHQPVSVVSPGEGLNSAVVCFSGFTGKERIFLSHLAVLLGATVQEAFSRKDNPKKNVIKSTHLVCYEPSGSKYEAALKWGIPVVSKTWLLEATKANKGPPEETSFSISKGQEEKTKDCSSSKENETSETPKTSKASEVVAQTPVAIEQPSNSSVQSSNRSNFITPDINVEVPKRSSLSLKRSLNSSGNEWSPKVALKSHGTPLTSQENNFSPINTPLNKLKCNTSSLSDMLTPDTPYGQVFVDNPSSATRKQWKKYIDHFPNFKDKRTPESVLRKQIFSKFGNVKFEGIEVGTGKLLKNGPYAEWAHTSSSESPTVPAKQATVCSTREEVVASPTCSPKDNAENSSSSNEMVNELRSLMSEIQKESGKKDLPREEVDEKLVDRLRRKTDGRKSTDSNHPLNKIRPSLGLNFEAERPASTGDTEPMSEEKREEEMSVEQIAAEFDAAEEMEEEKEEEEELPHDGRVFMLSSLSEEAKQKYEGIILSLGGRVSTVNSYVEESTHLVIVKPVRNEKLLCSIASGKWVLHISYLDQCYEARQFLPEEDYEWGNPRSESRLPMLEPGTQTDELAKAAYKWRKQCNNLNQKAFRHMKAALFVREAMMPMFTRLIEAGGGVVISNPLDGNLCLIEEGRVELPAELSGLSAKDIPCVPLVYLAKYLSKYPNINPTDYLIDAYPKKK